jgi:predicted nucleic acid-binding protein
MPASLPNLVLLDNTVLSNFAQIGRSDLVMSLWAGCSTTMEARQEFLVGLAAGKLPLDVWQDLPLIDLTGVEREFADGLSKVLGLGERTCVAAVKFRGGMLVSDDRKARQVALEIGVKVTGTLGILVIDVERKRITLEEANQVLEKMIEYGYRSPVKDLGSLISK